MTKKTQKKLQVLIPFLIVVTSVCLPLVVAFVRFFLFCFNKNALSDVQVAMNAALCLHLVIVGPIALNFSLW